MRLASTLAITNDRLPNDSAFSYANRSRDRSKRMLKSLDGLGMPSLYHFDTNGFSKGFLRGHDG